MTPVIFDLNARDRVSPDAAPSLNRNRPSTTPPPTSPFPSFDSRESLIRFATKNSAQVYDGAPLIRLQFVAITLDLWGFNLRANPRTDSLFTCFSPIPFFPLESSDPSFSFHFSLSSFFSLGGDTEKVLPVLRECEYEHLSKYA